jgi:hypothetical protein
MTPEKKNMNPTWSAVITTFNSAATIESALNSIQSLSGLEMPADIIVVDNNSQDNTLEIVSNRHGVKVIAGSENLGLARANNQGAKVALGEHLFFLNPDAMVLPGAVTSLMRFSLFHPEAAILGPAMTDENGILQSTARTWPSLLSIAARRSRLGNTALGKRAVDRHLNRFNTDEPQPVPWLIGAALWLTPRGRSTVGLMNEAYFLYFEDVEWCRRAWKSGMEVWRVPEALITHECRRQSAGGSRRAAGLHLRSMIRFFAAHPSALIGKGPGPS